MNNRTRKIFAIILSSIQILFVIGMIVLYRLSKTRMGVMRHIVYQNQKWETTINMQVASLIFCIINLIFIIVGIYKGIKTKSVLARGNWLLLTIFSVMAILYNLCLSPQIIRIYYHEQLVWMIVSSLQLWKSISKHEVIS